MDAPIVELSTGKIRGLVSDKFYSFLGIPYGKPPIGDLRFKAPEPVEPWDGIRDTMTIGNMCMQKDLLSDVEGCEDCLNLNVFTRELPGGNTQLKPVLVFIHGGAFITGSNCTDTYGPDYLLLEDIVLVTPNYRLGILGFLSLEDQSLGVLGNAGLKDQRLALSWVQENIIKFNGDPNNVTIFGHSAGAISVHYQVLSSCSTNLFNKAIMFSGSTLCKWSKTVKFSIEKYLEILNIQVKSEKEALSILNDLSPQTLVKTAHEYIKLHAGRSLMFTPVIEKPNNTSIITKDDIDLILNGEFSRIPLMMSYTSNEGLIFVLIERLLKSSGVNIPNERLQPQQILPVEYQSRMTGSELHMICSEMEKVYDNENETLRKSLMLSDFHFLVPVIATAKTHAVLSKHPVYLLKWSLSDELNIIKRDSLISDVPGTCHADELVYIFHKKLPSTLSTDSKAQDIKGNIVKMIGNFCKFGNPTPHEEEFGFIWPSVETDNSFYVNVGTEITLKRAPESERMEIWQKILEYDKRQAELNCLKV